MKDKDYKVVKYTASNYNEWNNFINIAKNSTFLFHRDFMEYHDDKFEDFSLLVYKDNKLIAIFPAHKIKNKIFSHQGLTYGGLVINENLRFSNIIASFKAILIFSYQNCFTELYLKIIPSIYNSYPSDELLYLLHILNAKLIRRDTLSVVNMLNPLKLAKDRLSGAKRAKKLSLTIKEDDDFDIFWNTVLIPNLKKKYNTRPVHSLNQIKYLKERFPKNIKQFNIFKDNTILAGTTIFITNKVAHSQYISARENKNKTGCLDLLHTHLLKHTFKNKHYFDFGISHVNNGMNINSGLLYWKEGFGARSIIHDFYRVETSKYKDLDTIMI